MVHHRASHILWAGGKREVRLLDTDATPKEIALTLHQKNHCWPNFGFPKYLLDTYQWHTSDVIEALSEWIEC